MRYRASAGRGTAPILAPLTIRCAQRLERVLGGRCDPKLATAHAIRILLRRAGTRTTVAAILRRKP